MGLTVHHLGHSQSDRVVWLCEELGITYTLKKYDRDPFLSPPELKALHPLGASAVIEDVGGVKIAETQACVQYIAEVHGKGKFVVKPGEKNYADYLYWFAVGNGSFQPLIGRLMTLKMAGVPEDNETYSRFTERLELFLKFMDKRLGEVPWLAGDELTLADIMSIFSLTGMREFYGYDLSDCKNILAYMKKIVERPAFKSSLEKGDPDIKKEDFIQGHAPPFFQPKSKK